MVPGAGRVVWVRIRSGSCQGLRSMVNSRGRCFHGPLHSIGALHRGGCEKRCLDGEYRADARKVVEANGGKVVDSYSSLRRYYLVAVVESADNATLLSISARSASQLP